ncbi:uncharacterized protein LOC124493424 [Dermatophagoides farinae]|uniref:uncharacterized protein LOC124493424 n=1 Tax=Dermatophagoides farinae TaxID=6954 RepID=UPI003F64319C
MPDIIDLTMENELNDISMTNPDDSINVSSSNESFEKPSAKKRIKLSHEDRIRIKAEKEKLREEREQLRMEKEMARLEREKVRIEKEKMKMAREKQILEEREKKQNEQQMKMQMKEKIRKEKEEEKNRKEMEKQKRLEERQAIVEEENKKKEMAKKLEEKSRAVLFNFLRKSSSGVSENDQNSSFTNRMAMSTDNEMDCGGSGGEYSFVPKNLINSFDSDQFERLITDQNESVEHLYLACLLSGQKVPYSCPIIQSSSSSINVDDELLEQYHPVNYIYLKFHENLKPPYFGPKTLTTEMDGRRPFIKLESLDYEVDSDEEWDEGGPGESLSNTDSEPEEKDDYEIDNDFFVPHGYLSDDEFNLNSDLAANANNESQSRNNNSPLTKEQTLLNERSRLADKLTPQVIGCFWTSSSPTLEQQQQQQQLFGMDKLKFLEQFKICLIPSIAIKP